MTPEQQADQLLTLADRFSATVQSYRQTIQNHQQSIDSGADTQTTALMKVEISACRRAIDVLEGKLPELIYKPAQAINQALEGQSAAAAA